MGVNFTYVETTKPVRLAKVTNPSGYLDLVAAKNKNGKAIRIINREGTGQVFIGMNAVDDLIKALQTIKTNGVSVSVEDDDFLTATGQ